MKQGARMLNGFDSFPLGNVKHFIDYERRIKPAVIASGEKPIAPAISYTVKTQATLPGETFDAGKFPLVLMNTGGRLSLIIADPAVIQDMLVTKNSLLDKTGAFCGAFKNLFGDSFIFSKSDANWK